MEINSCIYFFLEGWGSGDPAAGKMGCSEKALWVNSAYFLYLLVFLFQEWRLASFSFLWNQSTNLPVTNSPLLPYPIVSSFLSCQILTCLKESMRTFPLVLLFSTFWWWENGFWELDHILYFENVLVPTSYIFLSVNETCTVLHWPLKL